MTHKTVAKIVKTRKKPVKRVILISLILLCALTYHTHGNPEKPGKNDDMEAFEVITGMGGDFELTNHLGAKTRLKDYRGKAVLLFFGYTYCPVVCPTILSNLADLMNLLDKKVEDVQVLFISADPERDTPERLRKYVPYFHPSFVGLTGTVDEVTKVAVQYGTSFKKIKYKSGDGYEVSHSSYLYLLDPKGKFFDAYPYKTPVKRIAADIQKLAAANKQPANR